MALNEPRAVFHFSRSQDAWAFLHIADDLGASVGYPSLVKFDGVYTVKARPNTRLDDAYNRHFMGSDR